MSTMEIPRDQWVRYFDDFSKKHEGWIVEMDVIGSDLGDQDLVTGLPLVGVSADVKDRENRIDIMIGGVPGANATRFINNPKHVWVRDPLTPGDAALEVESEDGTRTLLTFHHVPPEETARQLPAGA